MGSWLNLRNRLTFSWIPQTVSTPLLVASKTKYLPSWVQLPQHCASLQLGNKACSSLPAADTSHIPRRVPELSVNRILFPSGDQRGKEGIPGTVTSLRTPVPSSRAISSSLSF